MSLKILTAWVTVCVTISSSSDTVLRTRFELRISGKRSHSICKMTLQSYTGNVRKRFQLKQTLKIRKSYVVVNHISRALRSAKNFAFKTFFRKIMLQQVALVLPKYLRIKTE